LCTLDRNDICLGCGRTIDEIMEWGAASDDRRRAILSAVEDRRLNRHAGLDPASR